MNDHEKKKTLLGALGLLMILNLMVANNLPPEQQGSPLNQTLSEKEAVVEICTVNSHHSGVPESGFLVKLDGLTLFHQGDYIGRSSR